MRRGLRVIGLIVGLAMIVAAIASSRRQATVTIISPPEGVTVPAGQAVEVRYRVTGANAHTELWCDGARLATGAAQAGRSWRTPGFLPTWAWLAASYRRAMNETRRLPRRGAA